MSRHSMNVTSKNPCCDHVAYRGGHDWNNRRIGAVYAREGQTITVALVVLIATLLASALFLPGTLLVHAAGIDEFELVETVPVETDLDNENIRDTREVWLEMINGATSTLDLEQFYVSSASGEPLDDILGAIRDAATRGVRVRFIADAGMYRTYPEALDLLGEQENTEVRTINMRRISGGVMHAKYFVVDEKEVFLGSQNFDWRALKHIHEIGCRVKSTELAEVFLDLFELDWNLAEIDNARSGKRRGPENEMAEGEPGEPECGKSESGKSEPQEVATEGGEARESGVSKAVATDEAAREEGVRKGEPREAGAAQARGEETVFAETALEEYELPLKATVLVPYVQTKTATVDSIEIWPVYSPTGHIPDERLWDEKKLVSLIEGAEQEVVIQLLTYSSLDGSDYYNVLENALRKMAARGVSVRMIVSDWSTTAPGIDCLKSLQAFPNIEIKLSTIPEWSRGFIPYSRVEHCKYMVVDGKASWIGSSNWKRTYFYECRNVGLIVKSEAVGGMLRDIFYKSWTSAYTHALKPEVKYVPPRRE